MLCGTLHGFTKYVENICNAENVQDLEISIYEYRRPSGGSTQNTVGIEPLSAEWGGYNK